MGNTTQPTILDNNTCVYCGTKLDSKTKTKEHVIARKFIPKGKLNNQWNLIANACIGCNECKGILEDDISAITMQYKSKDSSLTKEAQRKGKGSTNKLTGKKVLDSLGTSTSDYDIARIPYDIIGTAQCKVWRVYKLAKAHIIAFYYLTTYNKKINSGNILTDPFYYIIVSNRLNWGNSLNTIFASIVYDWNIIFNKDTAKGYFKTTIKKQPNINCHSWALEWNKNFRIIGFFGKPEKQLIGIFKKTYTNNLYSKGKILDKNDDIMFT